MIKSVTSNAWAFSGTVTIDYFFFYVCLCYILFLCTRHTFFFFWKWEILNNHVTALEMRFSLSQDLWWWFLFLLFVSWLFWANFVRYVFFFENGHWSTRITAWLGNGLNRNFLKCLKIVNLTKDSVCVLDHAFYTQVGTL